VLEAASVLLKNAGIEITGSDSPEKARYKPRAHAKE
jgi:hypothetical protein